MVLDFITINGQVLSTIFKKEWKSPEFLFCRGKKVETAVAK